MPTDLVPVHPATTAPDASYLPALIAASSGNARYAYAEFFAGIESPHTERAYRHAVDQFLAHCCLLGVSLQQITPALVSGYIRSMRIRTATPAGEPERFEPASKPTRKLHLAALRHFFDKAVERHAIVLNPAASVRGPRYSVTEGKTPAIAPQQARQLLTAIDTTTAVGLRDRAIIATLIYTAARVGAVAKLRRGDFHTDGRQFYFRLDEKGGKERSIPCRGDLQLYMEEYLAHSQQAPGTGPLFRTAPGRNATLSGSAMTANDMFRMVKRRVLAAGLGGLGLSCHSFRACTATNLLEQGVELTDVQFLLGHTDARTTQLYDRRQLAVTRNIVERIAV